MKEISNRAHRLSVSVLFLLQGLVFATWVSRIPAVKESLGLNEAQLGTALFAIPMGQLVTMSLSGIIAARFGSKFGTLLGSTIYPTMLILLAWVDSRWSLMLGLFFLGMGANLNNISINTQAVSVEKLYGRSIMSAFHGLWSLAGFLGGLIGAATIQLSIGIKAHFTAVAIFVYIAYFIARPFLLARDANCDASVSAEDSEKKRGYLHPTPYIITLGLIALGSMTCEGAMFNWTGVFYKTVIKADAGMVSFGFVCFMMTMAGGRFIADIFVTKFGQIRVIRTSGLIIFAGMLLGIVYPNVWISALGFMLVGFGVSGVVPTTYSLAGRSRRMKPSVALSCVCTIGFFGFLFGPPLIGYVAHYSNLRVSLLLVAFIGLSLFALAPRLKSHVER